MEYSFESFCIEIKKKKRTKSGRMRPSPKDNPMLPSPKSKRCCEQSRQSEVLQKKKGTREL